MPDYIMIEPGLVVDEDGEIIEGGDYGLKRLVELRHYAKENEDAWAARRKALDPVIKRKQEEPRAVYGDIVTSVRGGTYGKVDGEQLWSLVRERCAGDDGLPDLNAVAEFIASATGYRKAQDKDDPGLPYLSPAHAELVERATKHFEKQQWVETKRLAEAPPKPSQVVR